MNSEEENEDFLEPPSPHISQDIVKTKPSVPRPLTAWLLFSGLASIILCFIWVTVIGGYGGLNWENGTWHFVSMTTFLILTGVGASAFRIFTFVSRPVAKLIHAICLTGAFLIAAFGLFAIFSFHDAKMIPNMYTLHSWLGLAFTIIFGVQLVGGLFSFLFPLVPPQTRTAFLPYHRTFGIIVLAALAGIAMIGINEKLVFQVGDYKKKTAFGTVPNVFGTVLFAFALTALFILTKPEFKRTENRS